jgi:hypothetical protein
MRFRLSLMLGASCAFVAAAACGGSGTSGFNDPTDSGTGADGGDGGGLDDVTFVPPTDAPPPPPADTGPPPEVAVVYAHSPSVLYKLDPISKAVTTVGPFTGGCSSIIDLAIDENSNGFVTTFSGIYKLNLKTAACTQIATGSYPNSLSFVPKGTLDPNVEALVGYVGSTYVRINTTTGAVTNVGAVTGGYSSSGDIVSVKNGGTFLTVTGPSCGDCLLQVNPKTGDIVQNYGTVNHSAVYGLAFWAGALYGFDNAGELFEITANGNGIKTTAIPVVGGLQFWGAGSTTSAPATDKDGGGIIVN